MRLLEGENFTRAVDDMIGLLRLGLSGSFADLAEGQRRLRVIEGAAGLNR